MNDASIEALRESCIFTTAMHTAMGGALGAFMGLFLTSFASVDTLEPTPRVRDVLRDMGRQMGRSARNFALLGGVFSAFECGIESYRARHDWGNTAAAGCLTGATLAARGGGPRGAALGCLGFAAFSTAVEQLLARNA
jgi:mitochondrial import inner membrane translocase subunit TIM22